MRSEEEFRALVYEKAETLKKERKKRRKATLGIVSGYLALAVALFSVPAFSRCASSDSENSGIYDGRKAITAQMTSAGESALYGKGNEESLTVDSFGESNSENKGGATKESEFPMTVRSDDCEYTKGAALLKNRTSLCRYLSEIGNLEAGSEETVALLKSVCDDSFFRENNLIAYCIVSGSGSERYEIGYEGTEGNNYLISVKCVYPIPGEDCAVTCDMKTTFLFLAVPKGQTGVEVVP